MSLFETIALIVAAAATCIILGAGLGQIRVVARGIRAMEAATAARSKDMDQRHKEAMDGSAAVRAELAEARAADDKRHEEAMAALQELIRRTSPPAEHPGD